MSKLKANKINFDDDDFVIKIEEEEKKEIHKPIKNKVVHQETAPDESELVLNRAKEQAIEIINKANQEAKEIIKNAKDEARKKIDEATTRVDEITANAQNMAQEKLEEINKQNEELINSSKEQIEKERIEKTKQGYEEGYSDAQEKIQEELLDKLEDFDKFIKKQFEIKEKIIKSASIDILDIIENISKKILLKEINSITLEKIIKNTISLFEKKENINIILSEKYARLLFEIQNKSLNQENDFNFENFKKYENFDIIYNPKYSDDTIIIENLEERFCASIGLQLENIIRNIYENTNNGQIEINQDIKEDETE